MKYITTVNGEEFEVEIHDKNNISVNGKIYTVDFEKVNQEQIYTMIIDGHSYEARISQTGDEWQIYMRGTLYTSEVIDEREKRLKAAGGEAHVIGGDYSLKSPMPGLVVKIPVKEGDEVSKGDVLVILESMKMQNELKSHQNGIISNIGIKEGETVKQKQVLLNIEPYGEEIE